MSTNDCSLPAKNKLLHQADYQRVFRYGKGSKTQHFTGRVARNANGADPRLGLAISKKACRKAVDRNRIKRLTREYFRHHKQCLANADYIILAKPGVATQTRNATRAELSQLFANLTRLASGNT